MPDSESRYKCGKCGGPAVFDTVRTELDGSATFLRCLNCGNTSESKRYGFREVEMGARRRGTCNGCERPDMALFKVRDGWYCGTCVAVVDEYANKTLREERFVAIRENIRNGLSPNGGKALQRRTNGSDPAGAPPSGSVQGSKTETPSTPPSQPPQLPDAPDAPAPLSGSISPVSSTLPITPEAPRPAKRQEFKSCTLYVRTQRQRELINKLETIASRKYRPLAGEIWWIIEAAVEADRC